MVYARTRLRILRMQVLTIDRSIVAKVWKSVIVGRKNGMTVPIEVGFPMVHWSCCPFVIDPAVRRRSGRSSCWDTWKVPEHAGHRCVSADRESYREAAFSVHEPDDPAGSSRCFGFLLIVRTGSDCHCSHASGISRACDTSTAGFSDVPAYSQVLQPPYGYC